MVSENVVLSRGTGFMGCCGRGLRCSTAARKSHHGPNKKSQRRKNEEGKGEVMLVCWRFKNDPNQNHES